LFLETLELDYLDLILPLKFLTLLITANIKVFYQSLLKSKLKGLLYQAAFGSILTENKMIDRI
jgi:hypothetical protein